MNIDEKDANFDEFIRLLKKNEGTYDTTYRLVSRSTILQMLI